MWNKTKIESEFGTKRVKFFSNRHHQLGCFLKKMEGFLSSAFVQPRARGVDERCLNSRISYVTIKGREGAAMQSELAIIVSSQSMIYWTKALLCQLWRWFQIERWILFAHPSVCCLCLITKVSFVSQGNKKTLKALLSCRLIPNLVSSAIKYDSLSTTDTIDETLISSSHCVTGLPRRDHN